MLSRNVGFETSGTTLALATRVQTGTRWAKVIGEAKPLFFFRVIAPLPLVNTDVSHFLCGRLRSSPAPE